MIIVLGSIVATAITTLVMMVNMKGGTHFDPQVQEGNKSISSSFDRLAAEEETSWFIHPTCQQNRNLMDLKIESIK